MNLGSLVGANIVTTDEINLGMVETNLGHHVVSLKAKGWIYNALVRVVLPYAHEIWLLRVENVRQLSVFNRFFSEGLLTLSGNTMLICRGSITCVQTVTTIQLESKPWSNGFGGLDKCYTRHSSELHVVHYLPTLGLVEKSVNGQSLCRGMKQSRTGLVSIDSSTFWLIFEIPCNSVTWNVIRHGSEYKLMVIPM